jgi:hypothetical protein
VRGEKIIIIIMRPLLARSSLAAQDKKAHAENAGRVAEDDPWPP